MALTGKQALFVEEYLMRRNATEAAARAGYRGDREVLAAVGYENLRKPQISEAISRRTTESAMSADEVLARLADQARSTIDDFISFNVAPYPTFTLDLAKARELGAMHVIKKIKYNAEGHPEIELYDAQSALIQIGRYHKLFAEKLDINLSTSPEITADERAQADKKKAEWIAKKKASAESNGTSAETL